MRLPLNGPARRPGLNHRSLTGRTATKGGSAVFESTLENDWLILLDFDPDVTRICEQPFALSYRYEGQSHRYTPDALAEYGKTPGQLKTVVYEVKYREELEEKWQEFRPRFTAANRHCRANGWTFSILTEQEIRTPLLGNATFLRRYRKIPDHPLTRMHLLYTLQALGPTTPQALLAATYASEESRMPALSTLWSLIATRQIACDLQQTLTMRSCICAVDT